jgi:ABC-type Zn2+ transport system substrate-binding protein/surface adhesin
MLTGFSIGVALWKTRSSASLSSDSRPGRESIEKLEARLAALATVEHRRAGMSGNGTDDFTKALTAVAALESSVAALSARCDGRLVAVESRLSEHDTKLRDHDVKLKEMPTLARVVTTMEAMLSSTMSGLDNKLSEQLRSIEVLKTTVAESDELMERVLDAINNDKSGGGGAGLAFGEGYAGVPSQMPPRPPHHPPTSIKLPLPD